MFEFKAKKQDFRLKIEPITHLLVLSELTEGNEIGYIRMTLEQIDKLSSIRQNGGFYSKTKPSNAFSIVGGKVKLCCPSEVQLISVPLSALKSIREYADRHREHIAKRDLEFRSNR